MSRPHPHRSRRDDEWYDERGHRRHRHDRSRSRERGPPPAPASETPSVDDRVTTPSERYHSRGRHLRETESSRETATRPPPPPSPAAASPRSPRSQRIRERDQQLLQPIEKKNFSMTLLAVGSLFLAYIVIVYAVALAGNWYEVHDKVIFRAVSEEEPLATVSIRRTYSLYDFEECISFTNVNSENVEAIQSYNEREGCNTLQYDDADASSERPRYINDVQNATVATAVFLAAALLCVFIGWVFTVVELFRGYANRTLDQQSNLRKTETVFGGTSCILGILATLSFFGVMEESASTDPTDDCNAEGIGRFFIPQADENAPQSCRGSPSDKSEEATTIVLSAEYRPEAWLPLVGALLSFGIILLFVVRLKVHSVSQIAKEQELTEHTPHKEDNPPGYSEYDQHQYSYPPYSYSSRRYPALPDQ
eukprot:gb/GECG01006758.1/.p1 GENE.gb/GECG01006758.1/~~gb/GECG01006758.1/.p1  ORF type:complete len:422 (+),score=42.96 gb/GECG01006758.1/:1-1266(+)